MESDKATLQTQHEHIMYKEFRETAGCEDDSHRHYKSHTSIELPKAS